MPIKHETFFHAPTSTATFVVWDEATSRAAVIDPALDFEPKAAKLSTASADAILAFLRERRLTLEYVLETHAHADHLSAADYLRRRTGAKVVIGEKITAVQAHFREVFGADWPADSA